MSVTVVSLRKLRRFQAVPSWWKVRDCWFDLGGRTAYRTRDKLVLFFNRIVKFYACSNEENQRPHFGMASVPLNISTLAKISTCPAVSFFNAYVPNLYFFTKLSRSLNQFCLKARRVLKFRFVCLSSQMTSGYLKSMSVPSSQLGHF